jgi:glycosyltransferase involved in cell wall biosynthesis
MKPELSILVITKNEAPRMPAFFDALRGLELRHEVLVLDSKSTDATASIARARGARVKQVAWKGFAATKNSGFKACRAGWILSLDADENPDREFLRALTATVRAGLPGAFEVNRLNYFLGRPVWRSGWHPDWQIRLFSKGAARFNERPVHEGMEALGGAKPGRVQGLLHHHSYPDLEGYLARLNRYTTLQAGELMAKKGARPAAALARLLFDPPLTFLKMYFLKLGFLEGLRGFALAALSASSTFWKYAKWWKLGRDAQGMQAGRPWVLR